MRFSSLVFRAVPLFMMALALTAASSSAAFRIDDPNGVIAQADQFLGQPKFTDAFKAGDGMEGKSQFCRFSNGKETCFPAVSIASKVTQVLSDKALMTTKTGEGDDSDTSQWTVNRIDFEKANGDFVVLYLALGLGGDKPGDKDFATIEKGEAGSFALADGTKLASFTATITQNIWQPKSQTYAQKKVALTVGKDMPGISQLLAVQPDPGVLKTPIFKVVKFSRVK